MASSKVARILVVDDEPEVRDLLADALNSSELRVLTAGSGKEAIDLAASQCPDLLIADVRLGDCTGLEVIDSLRRKVHREIPAVVITGYGDAETLTQASRRRPVELMTKPLNLDRLRSTVRRELSRQDQHQHLRHRTRQLRRIARKIQQKGKHAQDQLETTCADLTAAYRTLSGQMSLQQIVIGYQNAMISARDDDSVFAMLFRLFAARTGVVFGAALVCDASAELTVIGRFGVPQPDPLSFCRKLTEPIVDAVLTHPKCLLIDAGDEADLFDESIRRHLPGLTILAVPLIPAPGELIGIGVLYRKGEQPFTDQDVALAELIAYPTAVAVQRND